MIEEIRKGWLWVGLLIFLSFLISSLSLRGWWGIERLRRDFLSFLLPVEGVISFPLRTISGAIEFLRSHSALVEENAKLRKEVSILKHELSLLEKSGDGKRYLREGFIPCDVIFRFPDRWFSEIVVDKGKDAGVAVGMAVLGSKGLVGEVVEVSRKMARVRLITSGNSIIGALIKRSRSFGVLRGMGGAYCKLLYVPEEEDVGIGDLVITAGMGDTIPGGLHIGKVISVKREGEFMDVYVKPLEDFSKLRTLWVLKRR
ncbi:MAG: rod shape-determining protein MreC [Synergistetes bacterium]|nr:rod shape-determining protein MreC [Synergistota bacterium]